MQIQQSPTSPKRAKGAERRAECLQLRTGGLTYAQIGARLGISSQAAHQHVTKALEDLRAKTAESAQQLLDIELEALKTAQAAIWGGVLKGDLQSIDRLIKIQARRAAYLGLDAPAKTDITTNGNSINFIVNVAKVDKDG